MNAPRILVIATLCGIAGLSHGDELKIEFSDKALKAFGDQRPLRVEAIRKDGEIELRLANTSKKHVVITKHHHSWAGHYEDDDGTELEGSGAAIPASPKEFFDHVVLEPHRERKNGLSFSSWKIWTIPEAHEGASTYVFDSVLSGYFPTIDEYVTFTVTGRLALEAKTGNQNGAGEAPIPAESK